MKGVNIMYFTNAMFNSQYVNPNYYNQRRDLIRQYHAQQDSEVKSRKSREGLVQGCQKHG